MTITPDSPLIGKPSGTLDAALDYAGTDNSEYVKEVWRLCGLVGLDPAVLVAQWAVETHDGTSDVWRDRLNPAGIGWTGDPVQNAASQTWANQTDAARGHVVHMVAYVAGSPSTFDIIDHYRQHDIRFDHAASQPWAGTIRTISDLTGRWATDRLYDQKIVRKHAAIFRAQPEDKPVSNLPRKPTIYDIRDNSHAVLFGLSLVGPSRNSTLSERDYLLSRCYRNRNGATGQFGVYHTQDGRTLGSLDWWVNGRDGDGDPIQASATVMLNRDGSILYVIPEEHGPWTNGDVKNPTAQSAELRAMGGNPNLWTFSMEIDDQGNPNELLDDVMLESAVWWGYDLMKRGKVASVDRFLPHSSINSVSRAGCPGPKYQQIMSGLRSLPSPDAPVVDPQPSEPKPLRLPEGMSLPLARRLFGAFDRRGRVYAFNLKGSVSQEWLRRGIKSIPAGGDWTDGIWPELVEVVFRGHNGSDGRIFVFSDGSVIERP